MARSSASNYSEIEHRVSTEKELIASLQSDNDQLWAEFKAVLKEYSWDEFVDLANHLNDETQRLSVEFETNPDGDDEVYSDLITNFGAMCAVNKAWEELKTTKE